MLTQIFFTFSFDNRLETLEAVLFAGVCSFIGLFRKCSSSFQFSLAEPKIRLSGFGVSPPLPLCRAQFRSLSPSRFSSAFFVCCSLFRSSSGLLVLFRCAIFVPAVDGTEILDPVPIVWRFSLFSVADVCRRFVAYALVCSASSVFRMF